MNLGSLVFPVGWWRRAPFEERSAAFLSLCLGLIVALPNRLNVPYALQVHTWFIYPINWIVSLLLLSLWMAARWRPQSGTGGGLANLLIPFLAWVLMGLVSTLAGSESETVNWQGVAALLTVASWTLPLWILPSLSLSRRTILAVLKVLVGLAFIAAVITITESLWLGERWKPVYTQDEQNPLVKESRGVLPLGVSTVFGAYYFICIPICYAIMANAPAAKRRILWGTGILLLTVGCAMTASRSTFSVAMFVLLASTVALGKARRIPIVPTLAILTGVFIILSLFASRSVTRLTIAYDPSVAWRRRGLEVALEMIRDKPFLGHGVESHFQRLVGTTRSDLFFGPQTDAIMYKYRYSPREPHNLYLLIASEWGIIGFSFFALFLVRLAWQFLRPPPGGRDSPSDQSLRYAFLVGLIAIGLHSFTGSDLVCRDRLSMLFWLYMGLGLSLLRVPEPVAAGREGKPDET
jgi:O-antigen ligase